MANNPTGVLFKQAATALAASITKPNLTVEGDLMVVLAWGASAPTQPGGWTQQGSDGSYAGGTVRIFTKVHGAEAATTSYTFTNAQFLAIQTYRGCDVASPIGAVGDWQSGSGTTPSHTGVTFQADVSVQAFAVAFILSDSTPTFTAPGSWTERFDTSGVSGDDRSFAAGSTSTGTVQWTASAGSNVGMFVLELRRSAAWRRFYLPSSGAGAISPNPDAAWTRTTEMDRVQAVDVRGSTALTNKTFRGSGTNPNNACCRQYILGPLAAQRISGSIHLVARTDENANTANIRSQIVVRAVAPDATTFRGTLLAAETSALSDEWSTTTTGRFFPKANVNRSLVATDVQEGDYLVIEVGGRYTSTSTATTDFIDFGDTPATALDDSQADTGADHPWVDFPSGLMLAGEGPPQQQPVAYRKAA